jgi:hypothetical protein
MSHADPPPDLTRLDREDLARALAGRLPPQHPTQDDERATATTEALGGLFGLGFGLPEADVTVEHPTPGGEP